MNGTTFTINALSAALPELIVLVSAVLILLYGVIRGDRSAASANVLALLALIGALVALAIEPTTKVTVFNGSFVVDSFGRFMKLLSVAGSAVTLILAPGYLREAKSFKFEFPVLVLLATGGMMLMISANDFISLYLALELQSLALYVVAAFRRDDLKSSEAGLKYFVLGALSSGFLLYGSSLVYGFTGSVNFQQVATFATHGAQSVGLVFGLVFILAGLAFKISAVPFHMWTPDVYEGSPTPVTAFFASAPKVAAIALLVRVTIDAFPGAADQWRQIIVAISIGSMVLGAFAAIGQTNIKRLMAYSSIGHVGFALVGLAPGTEIGVQGLIVYMAIYLPMTLGTFAAILAMRRPGEGAVENISDLAGLSRSRPGMALLLSALMFSLAGVPPLAGFFGKFYVFLAAIQSGYYALAVIGVLASVVGAFYYLRIVKIMYFDEPAPAFEATPAPLQFVLGLSGLFVLLFFISPDPLITAAAEAAKSLFLHG
jgi:NADH-quinone oxidoreductase subunit N